MQKFTLLTTCKNRYDYLHQSIISWIDESIIDDIVVVDFDSDQPVYELLHNEFSENQLRKITVLRVENQPVWKIGLAQNIGLRYIEGGTVLKIDSDISIKSLDEYVKIFNQLESCYVRGQHQLGTSSGMILTEIDNFKEAGYYNEHLTGWGGDDSDLYRRLNNLGKERRNFNSDDFSEIKQNLSIKNSNAKKLDSLILQDDSLASDPKFTSVRNFVLTSIMPQTIISNHAFSYSRINKNLVNVNILNAHEASSVARTFIEIANLIAVSLFKNGMGLDVIASNKLLARAFDVVKNSSSQ